MKKKDVVSFFGTSRATAKAIGMSCATVDKWGEEVPEMHHKKVIRAANDRLSEMMSVVEGWIRE